MAFFAVFLLAMTHHQCRTRLLPWHRTIAAPMAANSHGVGVFVSVRREGKERSDLQQDRGEETKNIFCKSTNLSLALKGVLF